MPTSKPVQMAPAPSSVTEPAKPSQKKPCFVISPIGPEGSDTRKRADQVLKHIIKKALSDTYAVERADDISKPGLITLQVIERLMKDPIVVADLTDANANVYYELAIRHFVKKPVVHLITEGQEPPFDVAQMRYIRYDLTNPDSVERAGHEVRDQVANSEKGEPTLTPIQFVEMLDTARDEGKNQFVSLALGLQSALSNLQSDVRQVGTQVSFLTEAALEERGPSGLFGTEPLTAVTQWTLQRGLSRRRSPDFFGTAVAAAKSELATQPKTGQPEGIGAPIAPPIATPKDEK